MEPKAGHWESISAGQKMLTLTTERVMKGEEGGERGKGREKGRRGEERKKVVRPGFKTRSSGHSSKNVTRST